MKIEEAAALALGLLSTHGLSYWTLQFTDWNCTAARCIRLLRIIALSVPFIECNDEAGVREMVLHEIAHALTAGDHDEAWVAVAKRIGCSAEPQPILNLPATMEPTDEELEIMTWKKVLDAPG